MLLEFKVYNVNFNRHATGSKNNFECLSAAVANPLRK
jgi:hypothetical protein